MPLNACFHHRDHQTSAVCMPCNAQMCCICQKFSLAGSDRWMDIAKHFISIISQNGEELGFKTFICPKIQIPLHCCLNDLINLPYPCCENFQSCAESLASRLVLSIKIRSFLFYTTNLMWKNSFV